MLTEHLQTVEVYEDQAIDTVDDLRPEDDEVTHHRIDLDEFFDGVVVKSEEDIEAPLDRLRTRLQELLDDDEDVEIRFD
jgi:hypothetical protein